MFKKSLAVMMAICATTFADSIPWNSTSIESQMMDVIWTGKKFVACGGGQIASSKAGSKWSAVQGTYDRSILYGALADNGSVTVAVGGKGTVARSANDSSWTSFRIAGSNVDIVSVVWTGTEFTAIGNDIAAKVPVWFTSNNGVTWSTQGMITSTGRVRSIASDSGILYALGDSGFIMSKPHQGTTWTNANYSSHLPIERMNWNQFIDLDSMQVLISSSGYYATSTKGNPIWDVSESRIPGECSEAIRIPGGLLLGCSMSTLQTTDLKTWVPQSEYSVFGLASNGSVLVAATWARGIRTTAKPPKPLQFSSIQSSSKYRYWNMAYGAGTFVAAPGSGATFVAVSKDGIHWAERKLSASAISIDKISYGNGKFVISGDYSGFFESTDGLDWTKIQAERVGSIVRWKNGYVGFNWLYHDSIVFSADGVNWTRGPKYGDRYSVPYIESFGDTLVVFSGTNGSGQLSLDGLRWEPIPDFPGVKFIIRDGSQYLGSSIVPGYFYESSDLKTWRALPMASGFSKAYIWGGIARTSGNRHFVAADSGFAYYTDDLTEAWDSLRHPTGKSFRAMATSDEGRMVAIADSGLFVVLGDSAVQMTYETWTPDGVKPRLGQSSNVRLSGRHIVIDPSLAKAGFKIEGFDVQGRSLVIQSYGEGTDRVAIRALPANTRILSVAFENGQASTILLPLLK